MKPVGFSIIGCGSIGNRHADLITRLDSLVAVCDINEKALIEFRKKYPSVRLYTSLEELLKNDTESQVVNICTPNGLHAKHTIQALEMGKHVLCEKPMALNVNDCRSMIEAAEIMKRHLFIIKQNRYNPPVQLLKEVIVNGMLGKIYEAQLNCFWNRDESYYNGSPWKGTKDLDGGILFTQFSHFIDLLLWLVGDVKSVSAKSANFGHNNIIEFDDTIIALLEFESDILATLNCTINSYGKNMEGSITIFAENGTVKVGGQYLNILEYQNIKNYKMEDTKEHQPANDYGYYQGSMSNHDKVIQNVIDVINFNGIIAVGGKEGLKTVRVIEEIYNSLEHSFNYNLYGQIG